MNCSGVLCDHRDTPNSTLPRRVSLIVLAEPSTASWNSSFSRMYGIGSLFHPLLWSHSWGLSPFGTALLNIILLRAVPSLVLMNRALKNVFRACCLNGMILVGLNRLRHRNMLPNLWWLEEKGSTWYNQPACFNGSMQRICWLREWRQRSPGTKMCSVTIAHTGTCWLNIVGSIVFYCRKVSQFWLSADTDPSLVSWWKLVRRIIVWKW